MAISAFGEKVRTDELTVAYRFSDNFKRGWDGVLVIPFGELGSWYVEGDEDRSPEDRHPIARIVFGRAYRRHKQTGQWPERVSYYA